MPNKSRINLLKTVLCFVVLFIGKPDYLFAQTFFNTYPSFNMGGMAMIKSPDGNFFVGGRKGDSAMVMKITPQGAPIWTVAFKPTNSANDFYVTSFDITPDNFLIGVGVSAVPANLSPDEAFYFKISLAGVVQYAKVVTGVGHRFTMRRMLPLSASDYMIIAAHEPLAGNYADPICIKINGANGNIIMQSPRYDYSDIYIDDISESLFSWDKKFIYSTGRLYVAGATPDQMRIFITKFDTMGNDLWTNYFVWPSASPARMYGMCMLRNNDSLVICYTGDNNGVSANFELGILVADTLGHMKWSKNYNIPSSSFEKCFRIIQTSYGYAMIGFETGASENMVILAVNFMGDVLWCKSYGDPALDENLISLFGALPSTSDGDTLYFTGIKYLTATNTDLVIGKCDQNGDIDCFTPTDLAVVTTLNPVFNGTRVITPTVEPISVAAFLNILLSLIRVHH